MSKRDLISEIEGKKLRFPDYHRASFRLFYLQQSFVQYERIHPRLADVEDLMASLGRLFRARHIAPHEADFELISSDDVQRFFRTAEVFMHALDEIGSQIVEPNIPESSDEVQLKT